MKKLTGLVIVLLVLIFGGAWVAGVLTEKELKSSMSAMNEMNKNQGFTTNISDYKRGWFKSTATLDWKVHVPEQTETAPNQETTIIPAKDFEFHLPLTIHHGPIILADNTVKFGLGYANTEIKLPAEYDKQFNELFTADSEKPKLDISIFVNYLRNSKANIAIPAFKASTKTNTTFDWKGLSSMIAVSKDSNYLNGYLTVDGTEITKNNNEKLILGPVKIDYDLNRPPAAFFVGLTKLNLSSLEFNQGGNAIFSLEDFDLKADSTIEERLFHIQINSSAKKINTNNREYGPGKLDVSLKNLDVDALVRMQQKLEEVEKSGAENQQIMMVLLSELPQILSKEPELNISDLQFKLPEGMIEGNLLLSLPKSEGNNPLAIIQQLSGKGKISVPSTVLKSLLISIYKEKPQPELQKALVSELEKNTPEAPQAPANDNAAENQANEQIDKMLKSGLIVTNDSNYAIEFTLEKGKLTINGKPFEPNMLKF